MMEGKFAKFFISLVRELIPNDAEKEQLFASLQTYKSGHDLRKLLCDLRLLLNEPSKLELYEFMRPLIVLQDQLEYSKRVPAIPGVKLRTVRLFHHPGESLGFGVRGGYEHGVGIFVTEVALGSQADRQGLRVGDEIVRVNGFTIAEAIHDDVLSLIKSRDEIVLKVTHIGMLPVKDNPTDPVIWQYVDSLDDDDENETEMKRPPRDTKIFIDSTGHASLGCSILSETGPGSKIPGIFVEKVRPGSVAEQVGLEAGDQIMEVNETSFRRITWQEAVVALKSSRQLNIVIRKKVGTQLIQKWASNLPSARTDVSAKGRQNSSTSSTDVPSSPLGMSEIEPIYSVVNKHARTHVPENSERRISATRTPDTELSEMELIEQQLNRMSYTAAPPLPPSPTFSAKSSTSSVISTAAEVHSLPSHSHTGDQSEISKSINNTTVEVLHTTPFQSTVGGRSEVPKITSSTPAEVHTTASHPYFGGRSEVPKITSSTPAEVHPTASHPYIGGRSELSKISQIGEALHPRRSSLGGAAALMAERRLHSASSNTPDLLGPPDDYEWTDNVRGQVYDMFQSSILDGRQLLCLTYKKNADLGIDVEGGLGSPLGGKILVAVVFDGGIAKKSGKIRVGDQLMMINGQILLGITASEAERIINGVANTAKDKVELFYCESTLINDESSSTYF